jgi:hypothetical protein
VSSTIVKLGGLGEQGDMIKGSDEMKTRPSGDRGIHVEKGNKY